MEVNDAPVVLPLLSPAGSTQALGSRATVAGVSCHCPFKVASVFLEVQRAPVPVAAEARGQSWLSSWGGGGDTLLCRLGSC